MMTGQLFELLVQKVSGIENKFDGLESKVNGIEKKYRYKKQSTFVWSKNYGNKVTALFDGYTLDGDQIEHLQKQLNERLATIQTDLSYVVGKTAQHERSFIKLSNHNNFCEPEVHIKSQEVRESLVHKGLLAFRACFMCHLSRRFSRFAKIR